MSENKNIIELNKVLNDKTKLENIGSEIIKLAIKHATEEKLGIKPENPMSRIEVKKGDIVPENLKSKIETDIDGRSSKDWEKTWINLGPWERVWHKDGSNEENILDSDSIREISKNLFDDKEIKVLNDLNILDDITKPN